MQTLLKDLLEGEQESSTETLKSIDVQTDVIKQRIPNLRKGKGCLAEDFDAPLPDDFWWGKNTQ